jgi:hypothetical protein
MCAKVVMSCSVKVRVTLKESPGFKPAIAWFRMSDMVEIILQGKLRDL